MTGSPAPSSWFTADELAALALPGLPRSKRAVNKVAAENRWAQLRAEDGSPLARKRPGAGGGLEYSIALLPTSARRALASRVAVAPIAAIEAAPADPLWDWYEVQSHKTKDEAKRRLGIIREVDELVAAGLTKSAAVADVSTRRTGAKSSSIYGWFAAIKGVPVADRLPHLAPRYVGGGKEADVDPELWRALYSDFLRLSQPSWESCVRRVGTIAASAGKALPSPKTLWRKFEREVPEIVIVLHRQGVDALRSMLPAQERTVEGLHALELVNIDGHTVDVRVELPDGSIGRPVMVAIQDVFSRKFLAWRHSTSEDAITARLCFADLIDRYGIPGGLLSDNGRAFACKWLTGGAPTRFRFKIRPEDPVGLLTALQVDIHWALPFRGQSKPIERAFGDFCDAIAKHPAFEGAYTGNSPTNKPANYGERAVPWETFIAVWNQGVAEHNARPGRRSEMAKARRESFNDVFNRSYQSAPIRKAKPEELRMALLAAEQVRADRKTGAIKLLDNRYWSEDLIRVAGDPVVVRFDPDDATKAVHVYDAAGRYVAEAALWERTGFLDAEAAKRRAKLEADHRKKAKAAAAALDLLAADQLAALLPAYEDDEPTPAPTVVRPVRTRGPIAAALKPQFQGAEPAPEPAFIDNFAAGVSRLRLVGE